MQRRLSSSIKRTSASRQPECAGKAQSRDRTHHPPFQTASCRNLPLGAPDVLEEAVTLSEAVQGIVALAHGADETGQSVDDVLALDGPAVLVDLGDGDLARTVVLGLDDSARRRALAGDVTGGGLESVQLCAAGCDPRSVVGQGGLTGRRFHHGRSPSLRLVLSAADDEFGRALRCRGAGLRNFKAVSNFD